MTNNNKGRKSQYVCVNHRKPFNYIGGDDGQCPVCGAIGTWNGYANGQYDEVCKAEARMEAMNDRAMRQNINDYEGV